MSTWQTNIDEIMNQPFFAGVRRPIIIIITQDIARDEQKEDTTVDKIEVLTLIGV